MLTVLFFMFCGPGTSPEMVGFFLHHRHFWKMPRSFISHRNPCSVHIKLFRFSSYEFYGLSTILAIPSWANRDLQANKPRTEEPVHQRSATEPSHPQGNRHKEDKQHILMKELNAFHCLHEKHHRTFTFWSTSSACPPQIPATMLNPV